MQAGVDDAGRADQVRSRLPDGVKVEAKPDRTLGDMLIKGEIDAMITARPPRSFLEGKPGIKRLCPNYREEEERYYARTKIFPIMHVIAIKRSVYEGSPWIARNLMDTFETAKRAAMTKMQNIQSSYLPTGWIQTISPACISCCLAMASRGPTASNITVRPSSRFSLGATSRA